MIDFVKQLPDLNCISGVLAEVLKNRDRSILPCIGIKVESSNRFCGVLLQNVKVLDIRVPCAHAFSLLYVHTKQLLTQCKQASQNLWQREVFPYLFLTDTELTNTDTQKMMLKVKP
jgi:hypothetical protein